jgi:hypothetical protein
MSSEDDIQYFNKNTSQLLNSSTSQPLNFSTSQLLHSSTQAENDVPQPQVDVAFGLLKVKPRFSSPWTKSTSIPSR